MSTKKPRLPRRFPVREYLGKYESWLLIMYGSGTFDIQDRHLERFLSFFPGRTGWEQFTSVDIADYRQLREEQGASEANLKHELGTLKSFWRWLRENAGMNTIHFKKVFGINWDKIISKPPARTPITLAQIERLLKACPSDDHRRIVLDIMAGSKNPRTSRRWSKIKAIARELGIERFSYRTLSARSMNWRRDIVQAYCNKRLDALAPEAQLQRHTFRAVKAPASDEGTSITYSNNDVPSRDGVE